MKRVAWITNETITVCEVPEIDLYDPRDGECQNAYGVHTVAVDGDISDYHIINVMETAFLDWSTVDYICAERHSK